MLAPYYNVSDASPSQLRSKARQLALMNPTQLQQVKRDRQRQQRADRAERRSVTKEMKIKRDYVIHVAVEMSNRSFGRPGEPEMFVLERTFPEDGTYFNGSKLQERNDTDSSFKALIDQYAPRELRLVTTNVDYVNLRLPYRERNLIEMRSAEPFRDASLPRIDSMTPSTFQDTNHKCVPTQLAELLLKPASNNPKKRLFVGGPKVTPESIEHWFHQTFFEASGITAEMVKAFAKFMDRHYYRLSPTGLIEEMVRHPNAGNYAPIAFVIKNDHMHLYNDASVFKALGHLQVGDVLYSALSQAPDGAVYYEWPADTPIDQLAPGEYRLRKTSLNRVLGQVVAEQRYLPNVHTIQRRGHDITAFAFGPVRFVLDGAYQEVAGRGIGPTHTICKALCERAGVEHTNETVGGLTAKLIEAFLTARRTLTDDEKAHLLEKQDWKCATCGCRLCLDDSDDGTAPEFDHLTPRAQGGGNALKNFQVLCHACHSDKSDRERLEGYAYKPFWESRFNAEVAKILLSDHGKCWVKSEVYELYEHVEALTLEVESLRRQSIQIAANVGGDLTEWKELIKRLQAANKRLFFALRQAGTRYQLDLNKSHRRALVETDEPIYQFSPLDNFELYSETDPSKLASGLYVVHSTNTTLLSGSGVYCRPIVQRAMQRGYDCTITHRLLPSHLHDRSKVREIVDYLNGLFVGLEGDKEVLRVTQKLFGGNAWVGLTAKTTDTFVDTELSVSPHDAALWADRTYEDALTAKKTVRALPCFIDKDRTLYEAVYARKRERDGIGYTFYQQDLEQEKIWLDKLRERVEAAGGRVMHVKTDCAGFILPNSKKGLVDELLAETWSQPAYNDERVNADGRALKYKLEEFAPPKFEQKPHICRGPVLQVPVPDDWVTEYWHTDSLEGYTEQASKLVTQSACVTGESGTGKSELIKAVAEECEQLGRKYLIAGPTHLVARMHHGTTIAAYDYKYRLSKPRLHKTLKGIQNIIIDEAFMQGERYMELWNFVAKHYPRIVWTWVGDPDQFLPVKDTYTRGDYADNGFVKMLCDNRRLVLDKVHRCPDPQHLTRVRAARDSKAVDLSDYPVTEHTWLHICLSHDTRKRLIKECCDQWLAKYQEEPYDEFERTPRNQHSQHIKVQTGMPLICCRTSKKLDIYNGERYWYEVADDESVIVSRYIDDEFDQKVVPKEEFTTYFLLAFALTAHSVQGQTIKERYTIQDWTHTHSDHRFRYVTLGRAKESGHVQIAQ